MIISLETNENVEAMFLLCKYPLIILLYRSRHEPRATPSKEVAGSSNHRQPLSGKNFSWLNITWQVLLTQWLLFNFVKYVNQKPLKLSTFFISIKVMKNIGFPSKRNRIMSFTWLLFVSIINQITFFQMSPTCGRQLRLSKNWIGVSTNSKQCRLTDLCPTWHQTK